MPDSVYVLAAVLVASLVTWGLRALPFAMLVPLRRSALLPRLATHLPAGLMAILVVYTLRDIPLTNVGAALPTTAALMVTVGLHLWRHNAVLSILAGTAVSVALATVMAG